MTKSAHLNLQKVIATNALVVHFMVSVIGVATALILDKSKAVEISTAVAVVNVLTTYRRLEDVRGAGMSQRTRRPYLGYVRSRKSTG